MTGLDERPSRFGSGRSTGRVLVSVSVVLAVAAAVVLALGFDDARLLRLGVVAALWAALVGAFAAVRVRREAGSTGDRTEELREIYQLELQREVAARREHELTVERDVRRDIEQGNREELDALRAELRTLRENLESVLGGELLVERVALRAQSTRVRSLAEQQATTPAPQPPVTLPRDRVGRESPVTVPPDRAGPASPAVAPDRAGPGSAAAPPSSGLPRRDPAARADASRRPRPETPPQSSFADDPLFGDVPWRSDASNGHDGSRAAPNGSNGATPNGSNGTYQRSGQWPGPNGYRERREPPDEPDGAHTGGRSVEELLAAHGSDGAPRRRRRRDDA